jgi:hypothetical protein
VRDLPRDVAVPQRPPDGGHALGLQVSAQPLGERAEVSLVLPALVVAGLRAVPLPPDASTT